MTFAADPAHDHTHGHSHDHAHGAAHTHAGAAHTHAAHGHAPHAHPPAPPGFSLLRLSAQSRLLGALVLVACIWAVVFWAIA